MEKIKVFTDGGARGNPGPSGIGVVIESAGGKKTYHEFIGHATNNEAEYTALLFAFQKMKQVFGKSKMKSLSVECFLDSELVVKQITHQYKINGENIQKLFFQIWNLTVDFGKVEYFHIPREKNTEADRLANLAMDEGTRSQSQIF
ncbi:MAG: ribonuclease HI family protein [Candidatus Moranbacteria bacterium]|nr:ribonuclease HI family protein [Candidatus Moranbacteria bacterium]